MHQYGGSWWDPSDFISCSHHLLSKRERTLQERRWILVGHQFCVTLHSLHISPRVILITAWNMGISFPILHEQWRFCEAYQLAQDWAPWEGILNHSLWHKGAHTQTARSSPCSCSVLRSVCDQWHAFRGVSGELRMQARGGSCRGIGSLPWW